MSTIIQVKYFFYTLLPVIGFYLFLKFTFNLNLWQVISWWFKNFSRGQNFGICAIGSFFSGLVFFFSFAFLLEVGFLSLVGEKQELAYLGHKAPYEGVYLDYQSNDKSILIGYDSDAVNTTFSSLFATALFIKNPWTKEAGVRVDSFGSSNLLALALIIIASSFPLLACMFTFSYPVHVELYPDSSMAGLGLAKAMDTMWAKAYLTKYTAFIVFLSTLFAFPVVKMMFPDELNLGSYKGLPSFIKKGATIYGRPINLHIITIEESHDITKTGTPRKYDTGKRRVTFEFTRNFKYPVYVSTYYFKDDLPKMSARIRNIMKSGSQMRLRIDEYKSIKL